MEAKSWALMMDTADWTLHVRPAVVEWDRMRSGDGRDTRESLRHLVRVFWIDHQIRAGRYPNARSIADHFEVSQKTAQRTLDFMRDQLVLPLAYSAERRGWYYTEPAYALPAIQLTEGELVGVLLAEKLARQYRGTAIGRQVEKAFGKVLAAMTNTISIDLNALAEAHSFEAPAAPEVDPDVFRRLGSAAVRMLEIEITYFSATRGAVARRTVNPLHLRNYNGEWYLIAFDHMRSAVRDFHAGRIRELEVTERGFTWPEGFDLEAYLASGFGMIRGASPIEVSLIFDEYQSRWIRERAPAHPTETREELEGGRLRVTMTVTALDGVKRYVMQYGSHVQVEAPEALRTSIRDEASRMLAGYE